MAQLEKTVWKIARERLGLKTLRERKSDSLDFHEFHVCTIHEALRLAYRAGWDDATGKANKEVLA